jgi:hypothetical protein
MLYKNLLVASLARGTGDATGASPTDVVPSDYMARGAVFGKALGIFMTYVDAYAVGVTNLVIFNNPVVSAIGRNGPFLAAGYTVTRAIKFNTLNPDITGVGFRRDEQLIPACVGDNMILRMTVVFQAYKKGKTGIFHPVSSGNLGKLVDVIDLGKHFAVTKDEAPAHKEGRPILFFGDIMEPETASYAGLACAVYLGEEIYLVEIVPLKVPLIDLGVRIITVP